NPIAVIATDAIGQSKTAPRVVRYTADCTAGPHLRTSRPASRPIARSTVDWISPVTTKSSGPSGPAVRNRPVIAVPPSILPLLVDQPVELIQLGPGQSLRFQQVGNQAAHVAAEDPFQQLARGRPLHLVLLQPGVEHEGSGLRLMPHRPLGLQLSQQRL